MFVKFSWIQVNIQSLLLMPWVLPLVATVVILSFDMSCFKILIFLFSVWNGVENDGLNEKENCSLNSTTNKRGGGRHGLWVKGLFEWWSIWARRYFSYMSVAAFMFMVYAWSNTSVVDFKCSENDCHGSELVNFFFVRPSLKRTSQMLHNK